ncbi:hypothetical protein CSOJ01_14303 [Colletotrichum sojae]|uniref:Uncharacterized protein n=2 Tax=Colletotrichum orchidearum species complex TaxID=2707337 RepID=A0A8H6IQ78_9PEZI|nr:hypothetical protein CSOJ01_14303 [Colletotrichum sojae]
MKFSIFAIVALAGIVSAQSCAGGKGFCDGANHCQDGSGAVSSDVDPECVAASQGGKGKGGRNGRGRARGGN